MLHALVMPPNVVEDAELIVRIARGDREALAVLYDRHAARLLATGARMLSERREAEDVLHDVFLEVWKRAGDFDPRRGTARTWLSVRMRSRCLDRLKSVGRSRSTSLSDLHEHALGTAAPKAEAFAEAARVRGLIATLPEGQQQVLLLGYFQGLSSTEIGQRLGIPTGTVKSRVAAAVSKLKAALSGAQEGTA